ncbi:hypothetical protein PIB30_100436 [Stylosanthes scabra]|uniref:Uncharacterized protein n=1 Tax=Stylosanthes scabra TaxID=79078 RepID=A0ABU6UWR2_9FABA|nr:hypothetical protein [Stylosanthes scabra]
MANLISQLCFCNRDDLLKSHFSEERTTGLYVLNNIYVSRRVNRADRRAAIQLRASVDMPEVGSLQFGIRAVRPYRAWGWTDYASLHTLLMREIMLIGYLCDISCMIVCATQIAANRRNARRVLVDFDPPADTATFMAAMNSIATAIRDSTAAIRESAAATNRAMEYMGRRTGNNANGGDNDDMDNGLMDNNILGTNKAVIFVIISMTTVITWDKSKENNLSKIRTTSYAQSVGRIMVEDAVNLGLILAITAVKRDTWRETAARELRTELPGLNALLRP